MYLIATGVTQDVQKKPLLLHLAEKKVKEIYKTLKGNYTDQYNAMCEKLDQYFKPKKISHMNVTFSQT